MNTTETTTDIIAQKAATESTLVIGGNGKTGRRIVQRLEEMGENVRVGSRSSTPAFDWTDRSTWKEALCGATSIYISYHPDLAAPGASDAIRTLVEEAGKNDVERLVLLSGRGEEEAQLCEAIVMDSDIPSTVVRASWFNQNFSENFIRDMIVDGTIYLPVGNVLEPFIDADDIADVAVAALTEDGHEGEIYEVTGPELLSFAETAEKLSEATGREIRFQQIPHEAFIEGLRSQQLPAELVSLLDYLFTQVLDGRNAYLSDGVQRALGREPIDFSSYAEKAFEQGYWNS